MCAGTTDIWCHLRRDNLRELLPALVSSCKDLILPDDEERQAVMIIYNRTTP
jgi:hypothetical protein